MGIEQRVLVLDDDPGMGELVCAAAEMMGIQCTATTDSSTFLKKLTSDITIIILDLMMPGMDGIELLRLLSKRKCKADIVLMSAAGKRIIESAEQLAQTLGLPIVSHLEKPFGRTQLEQVLQGRPRFEASSAVDAPSQFPIQKEELQNAIKREEFVVHYQPQIDIANGNLIGVEALARWQHPKWGLIFPDNFIGRLERFGLIDELGWLVANRGLADIVQFTNEVDITLTLSLNASLNSLCDLNFPDILVSIAEKYGVSPQNVTIEITETCSIKAISISLDVLTRLRMKQVKLSIDDFGTGYATMGQFKIIPATELKIDRSFIQEITRSDRSRIMVQKMIEIGHALGMQVMAEGVETQEQLDLLRSSGCQGAQGFLFSPALPAKNLVSWMKAYRTGPMHASLQGQ